MPPTDNIAMMSNEELSRRLREYGVNVGPIVKTTRGLYEKKLRKLETGQEIRPQYEEVPDDDDEDDDEVEDEESEEEKEEMPAQVRQTRNEPRQRVPTKVTPSRGARPAEDIVEEMTSRTKRQTRSAPTAKKEESKPKGFPVWTVLFILLLLAAVGYLVVKNMEPEAESNIPNQIEAEV